MDEMTYSDEVNLRKGNVKGRKGSLSTLVILSCTGKRITFWKDLLCDRTTLKDGNTEFGVGGVEEFLRELNDYLAEGDGSQKVVWWDQSKIIQGKPFYMELFGRKKTGAYQLTK